MADRKILTTESGAPVADNQHSQTAGPSGPVLMQDHHLIEKLARFERERIPERVVHAKGSGAFGTFEVTKDVSRYTKARFLAKVGKRTEVLLRFSTVAGEKGSADTVRDPRGFAIKFYTEDGNYDLVGNNTPIFFLRDPLKFPDFIHSQKRDPYTNVQEPDNVWDFFSLSPETTHQFVWLFGDRGIPASYRNMDGFGSHTFQWMNAKGEGVWVKYHLKCDQGIKCLTAQEAAKIAGENPDYCHLDLLHAIERKEFPSWTMKVQIMPFADAPKYRFNPFDLTKVWSQKDYPLIEVGKLVLNETPKTTSPKSSRLPSIRRTSFLESVHHLTRCFRGACSPMETRTATALASTTRSFPSTGRKPLKPTTTVEMDTCGLTATRAAPRTTSRTASAVHAQTNDAIIRVLELHGATGSFAWELHKEDSDFVQAGDLYRLMSEEEKKRLVENIAGSLSRVSREEIIEKSISHFRSADKDFGDRLTKAVKALRSAV